MSVMQTIPALKMFLFFKTNKFRLFILALGLHTLCSYKRLIFWRLPRIFLCYLEIILTKMYCTYFYCVCFFLTSVPNELVHFDFEERALWIQLDFRADLKSMLAIIFNPPLYNFFQLSNLVPQKKNVVFLYFFYMFIVSVWKGKYNVVKV